MGRGATVLMLALASVGCQEPEQQTGMASDDRTEFEDGGASRDDTLGPQAAKMDAGEAEMAEADDAGPSSPTGSNGEPPSAGTGGSEGGAGGTDLDPSEVPGGGGSNPVASGGTLGLGGAHAGTGGRTVVPGGAGAGTDPTSCDPNSLRCADDAPEICDADGIWRPLLACEAPTRCVAGECKEPLVQACPLFATLPRFTADSHLVDGDASEFTDIEPVTYTLRSAPVVSATYAAMLPTVVTVRLAWSESAFVAHVHVEDPAIYTYEGSILEYYWQGDNVQFFIAPTDLLTGMYSGTEDGGATHLVIVPPSTTQPAQAIEVYEPCYACVDATFSSAPYAARTVTGGYEVELSWPWSPPNGALAPGDRIALNLIIGADDSGVGLELEGLLANNPIGGETPCGGATHPGCDDRTWCYSELE